MTRTLDSRALDVAVAAVSNTGMALTEGEELHVTETAVSAYLLAAGGTGERELTDAETEALIASAAETESADAAGLEELRCARGHDPSPYKPGDAYYEDETATWQDDEPDWTDTT